MMVDDSTVLQHHTKNAALGGGRRPVTNQSALGRNAGALTTPDLRTPSRNARGMPMAQKPPAAKHPLIGRAAHSLDEHNTTLWQVEIVDVFPSGSLEIGDLALVRFYGWMTGHPTNDGLIPLREMATRKWKFFDNMECATDYFDNVARHRDEAIRSRLEKKLGGGQ
jgi:hypothetical protein